jgi:uncharacterized damage-inducible protein DinB
MTNKEFFLATLQAQAAGFRKSIDALPEEKFTFTVHERSRTAGNIAAQLALQWKAISGIVKNGAPDFNPHEMENPNKTDLLSKLDEGIAELQTTVADISDDQWENEDAAMGEWKDKKYNMAWGFLLDAIHHRGQLTTFLRAMGNKVPAVFGPSADEQN